MRIHQWGLTFLLLFGVSIAGAQSWSNGQLPSLFSIANNGGSQFVAVGDAGTILLSPNGNTWTSRASGTSAPLVRVTHTNGWYVAVGSDGAIVTSSDGLTWALRPSGTVDGLKDVVYGNGLFVAVGLGGAIVTSPDGVQWTSRPTDSGWSLVRVIYANNLFVAVGQFGEIQTSSDGMTWTERSSGTSAWLDDITYGNGLFVVVASGTVITSADGVNWTLRQSGMLLRDLAPIIYANSLFVAVSYRNNKFMTSTDGITWVEHPWATSDWIKDITYNNGLFVAVGLDGAVLTSADGIIWTPRSISANPSFTAITYGNSLFIAVGLNGVIESSSDGISWSQQNQLLNIAWGGGQFVGVGTGGMLVTSPDAMDWTYRQVVTTNNLNGAAWNGSHWVVVGNGGTAFISSDGITWRYVGQAIPSGENLSRISWSSSLQKFIVGGSTGQVYQSTDGNNWTSFNALSSSIPGIYTDIVWGGSTFLSPYLVTINGLRSFVVNNMDSQNTLAVRSIYQSKYLWGAAWNGSRFMVVGSMGSVYVSNDGTGNTWPVNPTANISGVGYLTGVAGMGREWMVVGVDSGGTAGKIFSSTNNGVTWVDELSLPNVDLYRVGSGNGQFVAVGNNNTILVRKSDEVFQSGFE